MPRSGTFVTGVRTAWIHLTLFEIPAASTSRIRLRNPGGTIVYDGGTQNLGNASLVDVAKLSAMQLITIPGFTPGIFPQAQP